MPKIRWEQIEMTVPKNRWLLACFDLDGTLVPGTSTCQYLAGKLGHLEHLTKLEAQYSRGEISNAVVADGDGPFYAGQSIEAIERHLDGIPVIAGVAQGVTTLANLGIDSLICTVTWRFAAQILAARYGFIGASGTEMQLDEHGVLTGRVAKYFEEFDKLAFVRTYCAERQIPLSGVFAVGDARSDIPLFGAVGFSVALNATSVAQAAASVAVETNDLNEVLAVIPGLLVS
jgi:phosphoserine phosphatase